MPDYHGDCPIMQKMSSILVGLAACGTVFFLVIATKLLSYEITIVSDCGNTDYRLVIRRIRLERWWIDPRIVGYRSYFPSTWVYP